MKKLLVLALVVVLTLSLVAVASAAALSAYVGGRVQLSYISSDANKDNPMGVGNSGLKMLLQGKVSDEKTGTWGSIGAKLAGWPDENKDMHYTNIFDLGIKKVGGSNLNIWYSSWENENMKRGQAQVYNINPNQYHDDPMFNRALGSVLGFDYITDNVVVNLGYCPNKATVKTLKAAAQTQINTIKANAGLTQWEKDAQVKAITDQDSAYDVTASKANEMAIAATFKFDGGDLHVANYAGADKLSESLIGGVYKLGFGTISADYVTKTPDGGSAVSIIQANVAFTDLKFDVTLISDSKYKFKTDGGQGFQVRYTGFDKVTLAYKSVTASSKLDENDKDNPNFTDMYIGYKLGIFDTRIGFGTKGTGDKNGFTYVSAYASFW